MTTLGLGNLGRLNIGNLNIGALRSWLTEVPDTSQAEAYLRHPHRFQQLHDITLQRIQLHDQTSRFHQGGLGDVRLTSGDGYRRLAPDMFRQADEFLGSHDVKKPVVMDVAEFQDRLKQKPKFELLHPANFAELGLLLLLGVSLPMTVMAVLAATVGRQVGKENLQRALAQKLHSSEGYAAAMATSLGIVVIQGGAKECLELTLAHEYAHIVQREKGFNSKRADVVAEGHAIGVARYIMSQNSKANPRYWYAFSERESVGLARAYVHICQLLGKTPEGAALVAHQMSGLAGREFDDSHNLGTALYAVAELNHGFSIYRQTLDKDFSFLD